MATRTLVGRCAKTRCIAFVTTLLPFCLNAADPIEYTVRFPQAKNHYVDIEVVIPTGCRNTIEVTMATWTPGSYLIREYARNIEGLEASTADAKQPLSIEKRNKHVWEVGTEGQERIRIKYRLYCREMSVRTNWVDHEFAVLNGAPAFLTLRGGEDRPHRVYLELPVSWKRSICALELLPGDDPHAYQAQNFDELVDSPILVGNPSVFPFRVGGREHWLVNQGGDGLWDGAAAARAAAKVVEEHQRMWGSVPYPRYVFFNLVTETRGGLEHDNSTVLMTSRWNYGRRKDYLDWLALVSHEFFHTWNVRRLRPRELVEYDYAREVYFPTLWIAEGVTSYYQDLALVRAGLCTQKEYFQRLSRIIESVRKTPGRLVQSLRDSSHDTWIKFYRPDENASNARISYYTKGAAVAFLLDARIRQVTDGQKSLDDLMRELYKQHAGERGYSSQEFRDLASQVAGTDLGAWFQEHVDLPGALDFSPALEWWGLEFRPEKKDQGDAIQVAQKSSPWFGVSTRARAGQLLVSRVVRDSPAYLAGVNVDDEIVAWDGFRVLAGNWSDRLKRYKPGDTGKVLVVRRGKMMEFKVKLAETPRASWQLQPIPKAASGQQQRRLKWLNLNVQEADDESGS
ncbi:MAG: PDZ domain-containing protein [Planctomycetota bacterium]|nr:PDZ domain-containing protein [Planctomycetota bacterium]